MAKSERVKPTLGWFCVWGVVAIPIEGESSGFIDLEDRPLVPQIEGRISIEAARRRALRIG